MEPQVMMPVSGKTYPVRDQIKAMGGRWAADRGCWLIPADRLAAADAIVAAHAAALKNNRDMEAIDRKLRRGQHKTRYCRALGAYVPGTTASEFDGES